jgi:flagellar basal-body rod modification protein FlgD
MPEITPSSFLNQVQVPRTGAASTAASSAGASSAGNRLGKQDFLKLLMAQMRNQDPMKPMDDTQTIAQMAQFSALEAMQQLSAVLQKSTNTQTVAQAGALIGKYVQADFADGTSVSGAVSDVEFTTTDGEVVPTVVVDGETVDYSAIRKVSSTPISKA